MELVKRAVYTAAKGMAERRELRRILREGSCGGLAEITEERLAASGCRVIVLDFDGVLAPHGYAEPVPAARAWLDRCVGFAGLQRIYVLSNKPSAVRREFFAAHYPAIRFVTGVRKKPYPEGLQGIISDEGVLPRQVLIVDDRLLTGILAAVLAGAGSIYITGPYRDFRHAPAAELFFALLRVVERGVLVAGSASLP